jgi:hypothetical protein
VAVLPVQSNHRSWADFFVDAYLTEGRGQLMSRWAGQRRVALMLSSSGCAVAAICMGMYLQIEHTLTLFVSPGLAACRMAVAAVFPMFMLPVSLVRGCIVFKRGSIADKQVGGRP